MSHIDGWVYLRLFVAGFLLGFCTLTLLGCSATVRSPVILNDEKPVPTAKPPDNDSWWPSRK